MEHRLDWDMRPWVGNGRESEIKVNFSATSLRLALTELQDVLLQLCFGSTVRKSLAA